LQKRGEIAPKAKRNKQFCEQVHRANQHVNRIVEQRWFTKLPDLLSNRC